ncbi:MAG: Ig-like domain-containing protein, partial [Planctomycetota bacterium]
DLRNDRGETNDLAGNHPDRLVSWIKKWHAFAESSDVPDDTVNVPLDRQAGWGWHRLQMVCPALTSVSPGNGDNNVEWHGSLQLKFNFPVDFAKTTGKRISLYEVSDESTPVWQADPDESHVSQGKTEILFDNLPPLKPDCHYFLLWDHGWAFVNERPIGGLNDGAYWWRFRTSPLSNGAN